MSYDHQWAETQLTGRCKNRRKMANNTYLERREGGDIALKLHDTDIATYHDDGRVELRSGGWLTVTTKERLNRFTDASIWSTRGIWTISVPAGNGTYEQRNQNSCGWAEGVTIHPGGDITGFLPASVEEARNKRNKATRAAIKRFIATITPDKIMHAWENTSGDCLICQISDSDPYCLASHVEEHYFHASLAHNAIKAKKYRDPAIIMSWIYGSAEQDKVDQMLTDALGTYLRKHLLEGVSTK